MAGWDSPAPRALAPRQLALGAWVALGGAEVLLGPADKVAASGWDPTTLVKGAAADRAVSWAALVQPAMAE